MGMSREKREDILWDLHEDITEEIVPIELSGEIAPDLFGIEPIKAQEMVSGLSIVFAEREVLKNAYIDVIGLPVSKENLPVFKELRLKIVKNRTQGIEKWHKTNKAFYLAGGRFVDAIKNKEVLENEAMESKLMEAEKFFENQEKEKARLLNLERIEKIRPYVEDVIGLDFAPMTDEDFDDYLLGKKTRFENEAKDREQERLRIEEENRISDLHTERKMKAMPLFHYWTEFEKSLNFGTQSESDFNDFLERIKQSREADLKKENDQRIENAKLKEEAEAKELALQKEREKAEKERKDEADKQAKIQAEKDAEIKKEREAREKLEAEARAERLAKEKAEAEELLASEKLAKAPIKKQLTSWIDSFEMTIPENLRDNTEANDILSKFWAFKKWAKSEIDKQ